MAIDIRKIRKLIELIQETGVAEIEIKEGEESVRISCQKTTGIPQAIHVPLQQSTAIRDPHPATTETIPAQTITHEPKGITVRSPMVGTFYRSPSPGSPPFVEIGKQISVGDVLATIEAMKMFNPIESDIAGTITAILVENNQPVEFNQPLFIVS